MTAWARLQSPGLLNDPTPVRLLLDPNVKESYYRPNLNFPLGFSQSPDRFKAVLTPLRGNVRTLTITLNREYGPTTFSPRVYLNMDSICDEYPREAMADYAPHIPYAVSVVLGADAASRTYLGLPEQRSDGSYVQNTIFGWCFFGEVPLFRD